MDKCNSKTEDEVTPDEVYKMIRSIKCVEEDVLSRKKMQSSNKAKTIDKSNNDAKKIYTIKLNSS